MKSFAKLMMVMMLITVSFVACDDNKKLKLSSGESNLQTNTYTNEKLAKLLCDPDIATRKKVKINLSTPWDTDKTITKAQHFGDLATLVQCVDSKDDVKYIAASCNFTYYYIKITGIFAKKMKPPVPPNIADLDSMVAGVDNTTFIVKGKNAKTQKEDRGSTEFKYKYKNGKWLRILDSNSNKYIDLSNPEDYKRLSDFWKNQVSKFEQLKDNLSEEEAEKAWKELGKALREFEAESEKIIEDRVKNNKSKK